MKVYVWGLADGELPSVQAYLSDVEIERLTVPPEQALQGPLLVGASVFEDFAKWAAESTLRDGTQPRPVLLYLTSGVQEPEGAWQYSDGVVGEHDWTALDKLLECPYVLDAELAAEDVRTHFLRNLHRPVLELDVAEIPFGDAEWDSAESEMRAHLSTCVACRAAFNEALESRLNLRCQLLRPAWQEWLGIQMVVSLAAEQAAQEQRRQMLLAGLLTAFGVAQLRARAVRPRGRGDAFNVDDIPDLLAQLQAGATFVRPHRDFRLQLTDSHLTFDSLHGEHGSEVKDFRLELRRGEDTLWSAESIVGKASLPMEELERAVADGADQLLILIAGEEEEPCRN